MGVQGYSPDKLERSRSDEGNERALAYYRHIRAETSRLLYKVIPESASVLPATKEEIDRLAKNSEDSLSRLITNHKIRELREALTKESQSQQFKGVLTPDAHRDPGKGEKQFPDGSALQITYKILMGDVGAKADMNSNGIIDDGIEADQLPCEILKQIHQLWQEATKQPCGWYNSEKVLEETATLNQPDQGFQESLKCDTFKQQTLFKEIFDWSAVAADRIYECPFVKDDLRKFSSNHHS